MLGEIKVTERGFERIDFKDSYKEDCSLQQSSAIGDAEQPGASFIWLGMNKPNTGVINPEHMPQVFCRMHLNKSQVSDLVDLLTNWLNTGTFSQEG